MTYQALNIKILLINLILYNKQKIEFRIITLNFNHYKNIFKESKTNYQMIIIKKYLLIPQRNQKGFKKIYSK